MLRSILVALDGSPHCESAIELSIRWAKQLDANLAGIGIIPARYRAPNVRLVTLNGRPGKKFPIAEYGLECGNIRILVAPCKDIVMENHITWVKILTKVFDDLLTHGLESKGENRNVLGLLKHSPLVVIKPRDKVPGLVKDR